MSPAANGQSTALEDAPARELAQREFTRPLVLEAGAGTGKTAALVARVVAWSMGEGWARAIRGVGGEPTGAQDRERVAAEVLGRVVAITFTEAAAAEMAARVGEAFHGVQEGSLPSGLLESVLPDGAEERVARARALLASLDHLRVSTIHAYCRRLLARYPMEAGLHPRFQVDPTERAASEVVREVVEATLREGYAPARDAGAGADAGGDLLELAVEGFGPPELQEALLDLVREGVTPEDLEADPFGPERAEACLETLRTALDGALGAEAGTLAEVKWRMTPQPREALVRVRASVANASHDAQGLTQVVREIGELCPGNVLNRFGAWAKDDFGKAESQALGDRSVAFVQAMAALVPRLRAVQRIDPERIGRLWRVLGRLIGSVADGLRRRGVATYASLLRDAADLLSGHPDVAARERRGLDQLLVDEFQDTDPRQCQLVRALALEGPASERPGLFLVGDPKQSIYGWRNADLKAYHDFVGEVGKAGGQSERLAVNFRSVPRILDEVERAVSPVMTPEPGRQPAFQKLLPCARLRDEAGYTVQGRAPVEYWSTWGWDREEPGPRDLPAPEATALEARALARDLAAVHADGVDWGDCAVLMRTTSDLETYLAAMRDAGVPYAVERDRSYYRRREVIDAAALVRCILDPNDHLALVTFLRSSAVGLPDAALVPLWNRDFPDRVTQLGGGAPDVLADLRAIVSGSAAALEGLDVPGLDRLADWPVALVAALEALEAARVSFEHDAADRFVERVRSLFLLEQSEAARYLGAYRAANLERFFRELADDLCGSGDAHALLRRLRTRVAEGFEMEEERPHASDQDAVRVMTIHRAKGLDFAHVYLVQTHKGTRGGGNGALQLGRSERGLELGHGGLTTPGMAEVETERSAVSAAETVRALYVALTRAEQRVVVMGAWPCAFGEPSRAGSLAELLDTRRAGAGDLAAVMRELAAEGGTDRREIDGARWVFPALAELGADAARESGTRAGAAGPAGLPSPEEVRAQDDRLAARRRESELRMGRPWRGAASREAHSEEREVRARGRFGEAGSEGRDEPESAGRVERDDARAPVDAGGRAAAAAGTAVHRILEELHLAGDLGEQLETAATRLPVLLAGSVAGPEREHAAELARETLERFRRGPLLARLREIAPHVVARELPVWSPGSPGPGDGAVACVAGAIDLVYRAPGTGEWVVADWKTDRVEDDAAVAERVARYRGQGRVYTDALQRALGLAERPRFELWLLHAGRVADATSDRASPSEGGDR